MKKPETSFIQSIHQKLKKLADPPFIWKIATRFTNGLPDCLYIGKTGCCLWVEYKVYPNIASTLQLHQLAQLLAYNQKVSIITKTNAIITINTLQGPIITTLTPWLWIADTLKP